MKLKIVRIQNGENMKLIKYDPRDKWSKRDPMFMACYGTQLLQGWE